MVPSKVCFWHPNVCCDVILFIRVALIRFPNPRLTKQCKHRLLDKIKGELFKAQPLLTLQRPRT
jgi:hypothetical protein